MSAKPLGLSCALAVLLAASPVWAETVSVRARVNPAQATLGDEIKLVLALDGPTGVRAEAPSPKVRLAPFELKRIEPGPDDSFTLVLTVFELGEKTVPAVPIAYTDASGRRGQAMSPPQKVKIVPVKRKPGDKDDIRGIKGPVSLSLMGFWIALGTLLAVAIGAFVGMKIYRRMKNRIAEDLEAKLPPHERAERELERLQKANWLETGKTKEYYTELSNILRRYFERRYQIEALESTTAELVVRLKERSFERALSDKIKHLLERADLVKFAKFTPPRSLAGELALDLTFILQETRPAETAQTAPKGRKK